MKKLKLTVVRRWLSENESIGKLYVNGRFFCYTLEDQVRTGPKVPGKTAIPYGKYRVVITHSPKFNRPLPLIENVPAFSGIRIHPGNTAADTAGCLLVGYTRTVDTIGDSKAAFDDLFTLLDQAQQAGRKIEIEFYTFEKRVLYISLIVIVVLAVTYIIYKSLKNGL